MVTAVLKSIGFQTADLLAAIAADSVDVAALRIDGGMAANDWFCQFLADVVDAEVERAGLPEATAAGVAALAAVGAGLASDLPAAVGAFHADRHFAPNISSETRSAWLAGWRTALRQALA